MLYNMKYMADYSYSNNSKTSRKIKPLRDIVTIQQGFNSSGRSNIKLKSRHELASASASANERASSNGIDRNSSWLPFINIRDVREGRPLTPMHLKYIDSRYLDARTIIVLPDDILLLSHGDRFFATIVPHSIPSAICSYYFYVIRVEQEHTNILPAYICWQLNRLSTMHHLKRRSVGTAIKYIPRQEIMDLPIFIPNIDTQRYIAEVEEMRVKENTITKELLYKKNLMIKTKLDNLIEQERSKYETTN